MAKKKSKKTVARKATKTASKKSGPKKAASKKKSSKTAATKKKSSKKKEAPGVLKLKLVKSVIGATEKQRATVKSLGLRRMHHSVERPDTPETRGMVATVAHLVSLEG